MAMKSWTPVRLCRLVLLCLAAALALPARATSARQPISLFVDATDIFRKLFHADLSIPVRPGPLTLVYPKWIPGYHAPVGMLNNIVGLRISGNGQPLEWKRDLVDMFAFHVMVPDQVSVLKVDMDVVAATRHGAELGSATAQLFILEWNAVVLYPEQADTDEVPVRARIQLPAGWKYACAMAAAKAERDVVEFQQVSLTTLVDSPLLSGKSFRRLDLTSGSAPPVFLDLAAEAPNALQVSSQWESRLRRLVAEAGALFRSYPYARNTIFCSLSATSSATTAWSTASAAITASARVFLRRMLTVLRMPIFCPMSTRTRGTASTGVPQAWRSAIFRNRKPVRCCGSTKVLPDI